jgi:hypothetical protein
MLSRIHPYDCHFSDSFKEATRINIGHDEIAPAM